MRTAISKKYGRALLEVAKEQDKLGEIITEADQLLSVIEASDLTHFFSKEYYSIEDKALVFENLEKVSSKLMKSFLMTVKNNGRLAELESILLELKRAANDWLKISDAEVITAVPITAQQEEKMIEMIKAKFAVNEVKLSKKVDEKILGGFIIKNRGEIIDASIKSQLTKMVAEIL